MRTSNGQGAAAARLDHIQEGEQLHAGALAARQPRPVRMPAGWNGPCLCVWQGEKHLWTPIGSGPRVWTPLQQRIDSRRERRFLDQRSQLRMPVADHLGRLQSRIRPLRSRQSVEVPGTGLPKSQPLKRPQHYFARAAYALGRQQAIEPQDAGSLERVALARSEREVLGHGSVS
jgi:hypothetical protein